MLAILFEVGEDDPRRVFVPTQEAFDDAGLDWIGSSEPFDDSAWSLVAAAPGGVGYDRAGGEYDPFIAENVESAMFAQAPTVLARAAFEVVDAAIVKQLKLRIRYDDGFIAWLNGQEVARANSPSVYPAWNVGASTEHDGTGPYEYLDLKQFLGLLRAGDNVLAIRGLNLAAADEDALLQFTLTGESEGPPTAYGDSVETLEGMSTTIDVLANDVAGSGLIDPASVAVAAPPTHGTAVVNPNGTIIYTPNGAYNGQDTFTYTVRDNTSTGQTTTQMLVASNAPVRALVPANDNFGTTWRGGSDSFNDSAWQTGTLGVGYDTNSGGVDFNPFIRTNVQSAMQNVNTTIYMRTSFTLADRDDVVGLTLRMRYDDGFAAFINGVPVASAYAPDTLSFNSSAVGATNGDTNAVVFQDFNLAPFLSALRTGSNVLAIHGLNQSLGSSDLLMQPELTATVQEQGRLSNAATVTVNVTGVEFTPIARDDFYSIDEGQTLSTASVNYSATILASNPLAYWRLDDTSTAVGGVIDAASDVAPPQLGPQNGTFNGFNPANLGLPGPRSTDTLGGQPLLGFEADNRAPSFQGDADGGNDVVVIVDAAPLNFATNRRFSLEAWVNGAASQEPGAPIISRGYGTNEQFAIDIYSGGYRFYVRNEAGTPTILQSSVLPNSTWQHVVATFDQNQGIMRLYVNAVEVGAASPPATLNNPAHDVSIGSRQSGPGASYDQNFAGRIDEVAVYDRALTAAELQDHYYAALGTNTSITSEGVLGNDTEPDGQTMIAVLGTAPANGTLDFGSNGTFEYVPNLGFAGIDMFTYRASDGALLSDPATVTITVRHSPPTALPNAYEADEDTPLVVPVETGLLANDSDSQSHDLTARLVEPTVHGSLSLAADGSFVYTPNPDFFGTDTFKYLATDGIGYSTAVNVTIAVNGQSDAPLADDDAYSTTEGESLVVDLSNPQVFADDFSSGSLTEAWTFSSSNLDIFDGRVRTTENGRNLTTRDPLSGALRIEIDVEKLGTDNHSCWDYGVGLFGKVGVLRFDYDGVDAIAISDSTNAICGGSPANTLPGSGINRGHLTLTYADSLIEFTFRNDSGGVITARSSFTIPGTPSPLSISIAAHPNTPRFVDNVKVYAVQSAYGVLANDTDPDGDTLTAALTAGPSMGTLNLNADGTFIYTPNAGFIGVDTFTYRANDGGLDSNMATATITVGLPTTDFGDAPLPYPTTLAENGARHEAIGPRLGATRDTEDDGSHAAAADGATDDDGVTFDSIRVGQLGATTTVDVQNAPSGARLDAWIDFNADGSWGGPGEQIASGAPVANGSNSIRFDVPSWAIDGQTFARFRLSTAGNLRVRGAAVDGEVEDYAVTVLPPNAGGVFGGENAISSTADAAWSVIAADMDGDGDLDVLSASYNDDKIAWYENDGNQVFTAHTISTTANGARSVFAEDMDGDGDVDVLSASAIDGKIAWYENDGNQVFTAHTISRADAGARSVFAADMDGDGDLDVLSASFEFDDDRIAWYENDGNQTFTSHTVSTTADGASGVFAADVDGDGDLDVLSASQTDDKIAWYENDGNQTFTAHPISTTADEAFSVFAADVDGDGDLDVLSASIGDDKIAWYQNDGNQTFTAHTISTTAQSAISVFAADMDGDGDLDVLSASWDDDKIAWYENDGSQTFTAHSISTAAAGARSVFAADVDGDGDLDVLSASNNDDTIAWYENENPICASCADAYSADEDMPLVVDSAAGVLANDGAQAGESLTPSAVTAPSHGTLALAADGSFTYTPNADYFGADSFAYQVTSNQRGPRNATVTITINSVSDAPVAAGDAYTAESGITLRATATVIVNPTPRDETLVPLGAAWNFYHPTNGQDPAVADPDFNTTWHRGGATYNGPAFNPPAAAMLGYGTIDFGPIATDIGIPPSGSRYTAYFRRTFELTADPLTVTSLTAELLADDAAVIYLNGQRVALHNMPAAATGSYFDLAAGFDVQGSSPESRTFTIVLDPAALVPGTNVLAVSVHNVTTDSSDLGFALRLDARIVPEPEIAGVLVNDSDVDGDVLVAELVTPPANGIVTLNPDGTFEYTSNAGFVGVDTFQYRASDGALASLPATATITVAPAMNRPPDVVDDAYAVDEDGMLSIDAAAGVLTNDSDPELSPILAAVVDQPQHGNLTFSADGAFQYTPNANYFGGDSFTYRANDGASDSALATVTLTIRPQPDAPVAADDAVFTTENQAATIDVLANDREPDGQAMTAVLGTPTAHGLLALTANGAFRYTPEAGFIGVDTFTYRASDGVNLSDPATVSIKVRDVEPLAIGLIGYWPFDGNGADRSGSARDLTLYGGVGFAGGLFGQALDMNGNSSQYAARPVDDAAFDFGGNDFTLQVWVNYDSTDGEQVLIEKFDGCCGPGWTVTKLGGNQIQVYADGSVDSPAQTIATNVWHHAVVRKLGSQLDIHLDARRLIAPTTFSPFPDTSRPLHIGKRNDGDGNNYTVDGRIDEVAIWNRALSDDEIAVLYNNGVGTALTLCASCADAYSTDEDTPLVVNASNGVLANDGPQAGENLTASLVSAPSHGALVLAANGSFTYRPNSNYFGADSFTYQIASNQRDPRNASATIAINPSPDVPAAGNDVYSTAAGQVLDVATLPGSASATLISTGSVWKYLDIGDQGTAWRERAFDDAAWRSGAAQLGYGDGDEATVVDCGPAPGNECSAGNNPSNKYITTYFRRAFTIDDPARVTSLSLGLKRDDGAVVYLNGVEVVRDNLPSGTITFDTLAPDFAQDDGANFNPFPNVNRNPLVRGQNVIAVEIHQQQQTSSDISFDLELTATIQIIRGVLANDTDADGDTLAAAPVAGPYHGALDFRSDGTFTYTPSTGFTGVDQFTYRASDATAASNLALVTINVGDDNEAPLGQEDRYITWGGRTLSVAGAAGLLANDFDANGDALTTTLFAPPTRGTLSLAADGSFTYTPQANFVGVDTFTYRVADDAGALGFATATIHVLRLRDPINGIPLAGDDTFDVTADAVLHVGAPGVLANDQDPELRPIIAAVERSPWHGSLSFAADGSFTYTPLSGFTGEDSFTYRASDRNTFSAPATVTIQVSAPIAPGGMVVPAGAGSTLTGSATTDSCGSITPGTLPTQGDLNGDGHVDRTDVAIVVAAYGTATGTPQFVAAADMNGDGRVSLADAMMLRNRMTGFAISYSPNALIQRAGDDLSDVQRRSEQFTAARLRAIDAAIRDESHTRRETMLRAARTNDRQRARAGAPDSGFTAHIDRALGDDSQIRFALVAGQARVLGSGKR